MVRSTEAEGEHALDEVMMWEIVQKQIVWALLLLLRCGRSQWLHSAITAVQEGNKDEIKKGVEVEKAVPLPPEQHG